MYSNPLSPNVNERGFFMVRLARVTPAGVPHHVIQRGNRRQKVFFGVEDRKNYLDILALQSRIYGLRVWAYCLMDNHVHLIVVPEKETSLTRAISATHETYTRMINFRQGWRGYLWQGRFKSMPLDEKYLYAAVRYVELNPVRAGIVKYPQDYTWSSAQFHILGTPNSVLSHFYLLDEISDWKKYLSQEEDLLETKAIRRHTESGRPLGSESFMNQLEAQVKRKLRKQKTGPKVN